MNETWKEEPIGPRLYGSAIYGDFYYRSAEWTDGTTTSATWTNLTDAVSTWTDFNVFDNVTNTDNAPLYLHVKTNRPPGSSQPAVQIKVWRY